MDRVMDAKSHEILLKQEANKFQRLLRIRVLSSLLLVVIGGASLYLGFRDDSALMLAAGVVFVIYAGIIQVRTWAVRRFVREVGAELPRRLTKN
ncbi:MAG: hypothetical protein QM775_23020 [Pirellulales bacterium]